YSLFSYVTVGPSCSTSSPDSRTSSKLIVSPLYEKAGTPEKIETIKIQVRTEKGDCQMAEKFLSRATTSSKLVRLFGRSFNPLGAPLPSEKLRQFRCLAGYRRKIAKRGRSKIKKDKKTERFEQFSEIIVRLYKNMQPTETDPKFGNDLNYTA
ncbi:hypothetical protein AKJ57_02905, partial [candidate division MSBL1 archaeon SCGC-AAA259A05]